VRVVGELTLFENETGGYVNRYGANGEKWSYVDGTGQRGNFASLAACEAGCLNEAQNAQGMFTGQGQLRCADQCRQLNDQVQQRTNGALQQLNNQLAQALIANPPVQATIDLLTAQVAAEEANIADLQQQALDCQTTCQTELDGRVAECVPLCGPCAYPNPAPFCLGGTPLTRDGTPLFFPVDSVTGPTANRERATIPEQYGYNGFPFEDVVFEGAPPHNFYFTTEVEYWFQYNANTQATLTFVGDDDVWVFLNGRLAVDLGGLHVPSTGTVTINGANDQVRLVATDDRLPVTATLVRQNQLLSTGDFGLADGGVYKISIFHAERQLTGSSFQLTLAGFERQPSNCEANCGDGILSFGEECDDTINDGDYGECGPNCKLGPFCGDRIVQKDLGESCDEGPRGSASCRGCRIVILR
jgi:fibro-slime domain-containing protein